MELWLECGTGIKPFTGVKPKCMQFQLHAERLSVLGAHLKSGMFDRYQTAAQHFKIQTYKQSKILAATHYRPRAYQHGCQDAMQVQMIEGIGIKAYHRKTRPLHACR